MSVGAVVADRDHQRGERVQGHRRARRPAVERAARRSSGGRAVTTSLQRRSPARDLPAQFGEDEQFERRADRQRPVGLDAGEQRRRSVAEPGDRDAVWPGKARSSASTASTLSPRMSAPVISRPLIRCGACGSTARLHVHRRALVTRRGSCPACGDCGVDPAERRARRHIGRRTAARWRGSAPRGPGRGKPGRTSRRARASPRSSATTRSAPARSAGARLRLLRRRGTARGRSRAAKPGASIVSSSLPPPRRNLRAAPPLQDRTSSETRHAGFEHQRRRADRAGHRRPRGQHQCRRRRPLRRRPGRFDLARLSRATPSRSCAPCASPIRRWPRPATSRSGSG